MVYSRNLSPRILNRIIKRINKKKTHHCQINTFGHSLLQLEF